MRSLVIILLVLVSSILNAQNKLSAYEYWFNNDYANAQVVNFTPATHHELNTPIDASLLNDGVNVFNIRYIDENNYYSSTLSKMFYKNTQTAFSNKNLVAYEYWFNNDYVNAQVVNFTPATQHELNTPIDASMLNYGVNVFNIRYLDENNYYSSTISKMFYKKENTIINNKIFGYHYWFDNDFANRIYVSLATPATSVQVLDSINLHQIAKGTHTFHFQFHDSLNLWSVVNTDTIFKTSYPIADFTYSKTENCDSTIVSFNETSIDGDIYYWDFGDGQNSAETNPTHTYFNTGVYNVSLTVADTLSGLDSTIIIPVNVYMSSTATITEVVCDSYIAPDGNTYTTSGTKTAIIPNSVNCDSIITINLTIKQSTANSITESACGSYTAPDGIVYTTSGIKTATIPNSVNCDSVITINLTINTVDTSVVQNSYVLTSNASGASYQWLDCNNGNNPISGVNSQTFTATSNGSYAVEVTQNGCVDTSACFEVLTVNVTEEILRNNISIYPNPSNGTFVISSNLDNTMPIQVLDLIGKEVLSPRNIKKGINKIDATKLNKGVYILKIASNTTVYVQRIVID